jgi:hypothetical protein
MLFEYLEGSISMTQTACPIFLCGIHQGYLVSRRSPLQVSYHMTQCEKNVSNYLGLTV